MDKHATIYDVAKLCGVSVATVSRVLGNSNYPVKASTRDKVIKAARQLKYTPNAMGKGLKTNSSRDLGVIIPNITNPSFATLLRGIQSEARRHGYNILLCNSSREVELEGKNIEMLLEKRVAGILLASIAPDLEAARRAISMGYPLITIEQELSLPCIHVGYDYEKAGRMMTEYLLAAGHSRIGYIGAPLDRASRKLMLRGYRSALKDAGIEETEEYVMLSGAEREGEDVYEVTNGEQCAFRFSDMPDRPTGYICINDMTALGAIRGFNAKGLNVPVDASIIGFDNIPYCTLSKPKLTTVEQHAREMGEIAAKLIIEQIEQPDAVQYTVKLAPNIVARDSVMDVTCRSAYGN